MIHTESFPFLNERYEINWHEVTLKDGRPPESWLLTMELIDFAEQVSPYDYVNFKTEEYKYVELMNGNVPRYHMYVKVW